MRDSKFFATLIAAAVSRVLLAQTEPQAPPLKPFTVCEILANPQQFDGKNVVVLGRSDDSEGRFVFDDYCEAKPETGEHPRIDLLFCFCTSAPDPPSGSLNLDNMVLNEKLAAIRKKVRTHTMRAFVKDRKMEWRQQDQFIAAFGLLEVIPAKPDGSRRSSVRLVVQPTFLRVVATETPGASGK